MNARVAAHILAAVASAIAAGTVKFAGLSDDVAINIVVVANLVALAVNTWMSATTTGVSR